VIGFFSLAAICRLLPFLLFVASAACAGTTSAASDTGLIGATADPLVASWSFHGSVPDRIAVTLTFAADKTFLMKETVAPWGLPAGAKPTSCITTDSYFGTYAERDTEGHRMLSLTFAGGTANAISGVGCKSESGTPMTATDIEGYRSQGLVPATTNTYALTGSALVLTPIPGDPHSVGLAARATTYTTGE
jgi:hypothetical protein